jgi:hypothetical protein
METYNIYLITTTQKSNATLDGYGDTQTFTQRIRQVKAANETEALELAGFKNSSIHLAMLDCQ